MSCCTCLVRGADVDEDFLTGLLVGGLGDKGCSGCDKLHAFTINLLTPALLFKLAYVLVLLSSSLQHMRNANKRCLRMNLSASGSARCQGRIRLAHPILKFGLVAHLGVGYVLGIVSQ